MDIQTVDVIWQAVLDGRYQCYVTRIDENTGHLTMSDGESLMLDAVVPLMYGAQFGPDVEDVEDWQKKCELGVRLGRLLDPDGVDPVEQTEDP